MRFHTTNYYLISLISSPKIYFLSLPRLSWVSVCLLKVFIYYYAAFVDYKRYFHYWLIFYYFDIITWQKIFRGDWDRYNISRLLTLFFDDACMLMCRKLLRLFSLLLKLPTLHSISISLRSSQSSNQGAPTNFIAYAKVSVMQKWLLKWLIDIIYWASFIFRYRWRFTRLRHASTITISRHRFITAGQTIYYYLLAFHFILYSMGKSHDDILLILMIYSIVSFLADILTGFMASLMGKRGKATIISSHKEEASDSHIRVWDSLIEILYIFDRERWWCFLINIYITSMMPFLHIYRELATASHSALRHAQLPRKVIPPFDAWHFHYFIFHLYFERLLIRCFTPEAVTTLLLCAHTIHTQPHT